MKTRLSSRFQFLLLVFHGMLVGCDHSAFTTRDPWFSPPRDPWFSPSTLEQRSDETALDSNRIHPVVDPAESRAEALLVTASFVKINPQDAEEFAGHPLDQIPGTETYLVRGVYLNRGTGRFAVSVSPSGDIWVCHGCLGHHSVPMKRQAVVLQLYKPPRQVFVSCAMAE
jgi:hypothetical protein